MPKGIESVVTFKFITRNKDTLDNTIDDMLKLVIGNKDTLSRIVKKRIISTKEVTVPDYEIENEPLNVLE